MARGLAVAVVVAALLVLAAPAAAVDVPLSANCDNLDDRFATAQADPNTANHYIITLDSSAKPGGLCNEAYTLPNFPAPVAFPNNYRFFTLKAATPGVDGFDGTALGGRMLTGVNVHRLTLQDLVFRDGTVTGNGGALALSGESAASIFNSTFVNNMATGRGGAVYIAPVKASVLGATLPGVGITGNTFDDNRAQHGGALAVDFPGQGQNSGFNGNTFTDNVASQNGGAYSWILDPSDLSGENFSVAGNVVVGNRASGRGGGGYIVDHGVLRVDNERYEGNRLDPTAGTPPNDDHFGGGLYIEHTGLLIQRNNNYRQNAVMTAPSGDNYGGGGLAILGADINVTSEFSEFEGNTVAGQPSAGSGLESEGGGIFFSSSSGTWYSFLDAVAGNSVGAFGEGGGMYLGAATAAQLTLGETTVANNSVGAGGVFAGLAGAGTDELVMRNSIVFNGSGDIGGFDTYDVNYSDACNAGPVPFAGVGNICADPKLVGGTNIHQTTQSPTIDKGNDAYFDSEGGGERNPTDYEGDPRPTDGDGDGHTIDMGADETPAGFTVPPPPPPPPVPQCSDQADNDGDGAIDLADPGCLAGPSDNNEGDETERDLVLCGERVISLVRADVRGNRVVLSGLVAATVAGQKVELSVRYLGGRGKAEKLSTVTPGADGKFQARVKKPARRLFNVARYRAQVGSARSVELKLPQSLASSSLKQVAGGMFELRGQVDRKLLGKRNAVVVKRILCGQYTTVGQAKPNGRGVYVVRFPAPATTGGAALYRAESRVLAKPRSKRYVKQFARAIGITF